MSASAPLPRLLASILGVEPAPASRPVATQPPPPAGAPVARGGRPPVPAPQPVPARQPVPQAHARDSRAAGRSGSGPGAMPVTAVAAPGGSLRTAVRRGLGTRSELRTAVALAEVLGPPRALSPYGDGGPSFR